MPIYIQYFSDILSCQYFTFQAVVVDAFKVTIKHKYFYDIILWLKLTIFWNLVRKYVEYLSYSDLIAPIMVFCVHIFKTACWEKLKENNLDYRKPNSSGPACPANSWKKAAWPWTVWDFIPEKSTIL